MCNVSYRFLLFFKLCKDLVPSLLSTLSCRFQYGGFVHSNATLGQLWSVSNFCMLL